MNKQAKKQLETVDLEGVDSKFKKSVNKANEAAVSKQVEQDDDYNQDADVNFDDIEVRGRHFLIKAPKRERESGLILSKKQQKEIQAISNTPGFNPNIYAIAVSDECKKVTVGDMILLSPHVQRLEVDLMTDEGEKVLYLMIHEDYVLMTKPKS